jgi:hypothetical protein
MRLIFLVFVASIMAGCGDEDGPNQVTGPPAPPLQVDSGTFEVTTEVVFNGCNSARIFDGMYNIQIDESGFAMGDWSGHWSANAKSLTADGETARSQRTTRGCTITSWTEVHIIFTSEDEFVGHIIYRYRVVPSTCVCCDNCQSTWSITGLRAVP